MGIASYILGIANISKQVEKQHMFANVPDNLRMLIEGSLSGTVKFGIANIDVVGVGTTEASPELLYSILFSVLHAKGNEKRRIINTWALQLDADSISLIVKVATGKLSIGIGSKLSGVEKFSVQLASEFKPKKHNNWNFYLAEEKFDGMRCTIFVDVMGASAVTRSGKPINTIAHILDEVVVAYNKSSYKGTPLVLDGELAADTFLDTIHLAKRKQAHNDAADVRFKVFDMLVGVTKEMFSANDICKTTLVVRKSHLTAFTIASNFKFIDCVEYSIFSEIEDVVAMARRYIIDGKEGVIVKSLDAVYETKRADTWFKIKDVLTDDLIIEDYKVGTGKYEGTLGAIIVNRNGVLVSVGGGFTDAQRDDFWNNKDMLIGRIAEIAYHQETPDGSLRHPRFIRLRDNFEHGVKE